MSSASQLPALTRLFSSAVVHEMARKGRSPLVRRLLGEAGLAKLGTTSATVGDAFDAAFSILKAEGSRSEYVYRAALISNILLGKHSLRTASALHEFRAGVCRADLVVLSGTASAYEIKSERDSLARLANQVENYKQVFATVNVIAGESQLGAVRRMVPSDVGIMGLSRRHRIFVERDPIDCPERICPVTLLRSLRSAEAVAILQVFGVPLPAVPNTQRYAVLRDLFVKLDPAALHREMVRTLKLTRNLAPFSDLFDQLPSSLHAAALSTPIRFTDRARLIKAAATPIEAAMSWV